MMNKDKINKEILDNKITKDLTKDEKLKLGSKIALYSTLATIFLATIKIVVGLLTNTIVLIADGIHSASDVLAIFASWFGLKISQKKPNERFPYGYYKAENLATMIISLFLFYAGFEIISESYHKIFNYQPINLPVLALSVSLVSVVVSYFIALYEFRIGKKINSQSLIANAQESKLDIFSSLLVFIGIFLGMYFHYVESIVGVFIGLLILKIAFESFKVSIYALMDANPNIELTDKIKNILKKIKDIKILDIKLRQSGLVYFLDLKLMFKHNDYDKIKQITQRIKTELKQKIESLESINIEFVPENKDKIKILIPIDIKDGLESKISDHFARSNYFMIIKLKNNDVYDIEYIDNPFKDKKQRAGLSVSKDIINKQIDYVIVKNIGEISYHTLKDSGIKILGTKKIRIVNKIIDDFMDNKLTYLTRPKPRD